MARYHVDFETRSLADLKLIGAYKYAQGGGDAPGDRVAPPAEVLVAAIAEGDDPPLIWTPAGLWDCHDLRRIVPVDPRADELMARLHRLQPNDTVHAYNYFFEWSIFRHVLGVDIPARHWRCTQVLADIAGLPHSLEGVANELGIEAKLPGKALINFFCKPVTGGKRKGEFRSPGEDMLRLVDLVEYCRQDVVVERAIWHKLKDNFEMPDNSLTRAAFEITHEMNVRGVPINEKAMVHAQRQLDSALGHYKKEYVRAVGCNPTQRDKSLLYFLGKGYPTDPGWFAWHGAKIGCMAKDIVEKVIEERYLEPKDAALLRLRTLLTPAAVKKLMKMAHMKAEDGNVHGVMRFYGANQTGRWASMDLQVQNMKRSTKVSIDFYRALRDGATWGQLEQEFGEGATDEERRGQFVMLLSDAIRHFIDPPGRKVVSADYASIEARITAWLAQESILLDDFESGVDVYRRMASHVFGTPVEEIDKDSFERHVGKSLILGCIAKGQTISTSRGDIPIENLQAGDRVWDGQEFVAHEGLIFKGLREVITWDGVTGTPDHPVLTEDGRWMELERAASSLLKLSRSDPPRDAIWKMGQREKSNRHFNVCLDRLHMHMRNLEESFSRQPSTKEEQRMFEVHGGGKSKMSRPEMALQKVGGCQRPVREPPTPSIPKLRRSRSGIQIPFCTRRCELGTPEFKNLKKSFVRSNRQQPTLRTGELKIYHAKSPVPQLSTWRAPRRLGVQFRRMALFKRPHSEISSRRTHSGTGTQTSEKSHTGETQRVASDRRMVRVYDILNCGPRHRFTVNGRIVHNCGYGLGWKGFMINCGCDEDTARLGIDGYRERHKQIVNLWYRLMDAALSAIKHPGKWINVNPPHKPPVKYCWKPLIEYGELLKGGGNYLICKLPSGRHIYYPRARRAQATTPWGEVKPSFSFMSRDQTTGQYYRKGTGQKGAKDRVWHGMCVEHLGQSLAADVMMHGAYQVYKAGFDLRMLVHDEANSISDPERRELTSALMEKSLTTPRPKWARPRVVKGKNVRGLPLGAEGKETDFFQK